MNSRTDIVFRLGDTEVRGLVHESLSTSPTMLNVHDDEDTSVAAALVNIKHFGGRIIELAHSGERLIRFKLEGKDFAFDPNRIFSEAGIHATLEAKSHYTEAAHAVIKKFANDYLAHFKLTQEQVILALHNTSDGLFSVQSFAPGDYLAAGTADIYISPNRRKFDFFYVTERRFFDACKESDFNVVLQDNEKAPDDGSLSVYFAKAGVPYINIEAEMGRLNEQIVMLAFTRKIIGGWK